MKKETETTLKLSKRELAEKLGLEGKTITFIQYDWKAQELLIKIKGETDADDDDGGWFTFGK